MMLFLFKRLLNVFNSFVKCLAD